MGARTFVRANPRPRGRVPRQQMLQWGRALSYAQIDAARPHACAPKGFNGGAHFRTRKSRRHSRKRVFDLQLQWGRALSYAQIVSSAPQMAWYSGLQWGRALSYAQITIHLAGRSCIPHFNGGAHFRTRKCKALTLLDEHYAASMGARTFVRANDPQTRMALMGQIASMGARTFVRANLPRWRTPPRPRSPLQWGRALSYAQIADRQL